MALPVQRKNHAIYPSAEVVAAAVTLRTNLCTNPSFETDLTGTLTNYGTTGGGSVSRQLTGGYVGTAFTRMTWSTASTAIGGYFENTMGALPVGTYTASAYVRVSAAQRIVLNISASSGAFTYVSNPAVDLVANTWTRVTATFNVTTTGTMVARASAVTGGSGRNWAIGNTFDTDAWLVETGSFADTFFDGNTANTADFTTAWTGTVNKSTTTLTAPTTPGWTLVGATKMYRNTTDFYTGTASTALIVTGTGQGGYQSALGGVSPASPGEVFTISAYVKGPAGQQGHIDFDTRAAAGGAITVTAMSATATFTGAWQRLSVTATVPAGADGVCLGFKTNTTFNGTVLVDAILIEKTNTLDSYFDGSTEDAGYSNVWQGTAHASASTRDVTGLWVDVVLDGTPRTVLTVLGLGMAQSVTKVVRTTGRDTWPVPGWLMRRTIDADTGTDWTVPLGRPVTYTLFKDGVAVASRTVTVPATSGDIMNPADPQGALKINTADADPNTLTLGNASVTSIEYANTSGDREYPLGGRYPISRAGVRGAAQAVPITLNAARNQASDALLDVVADAPILLVRPLPSWGSVPALIYTDATVTETPLNRGRGGQFTQWSLTADAVAPVTRAVTAGRITHAEVQANLSGRTHASIQAASGTKRHVEIKANPLGLGQ